MSLLSLLLGLLIYSGYSASGDEGCGMDPNGCVVDRGSDIDPNG